jgi:hypothetical protein
VVSVADAGNAIAHRNAFRPPRAGRRENASPSTAVIAFRSTKSPPITTPDSSGTISSRSTHTGLLACRRLLTTARRTARSLTSMPAANRGVTLRIDPRNVSVPMPFSPIKPRTEPFERWQ